MSSVSQRLRSLGGRFRKSETSELQMLQNFVQDLDDITESIGSLLDDMHEGYEDQITSKRSGARRFVARMPMFLQSKELREEQSKLQDINSARDRVSVLAGALKEVGNALTELPSEEEMGRRIYNVAYPQDKQIDPKKAANLEERLSQLETSFLDSLDQISGQVTQITENLHSLSGQMEEQGVIIGGIDQKLDRVESKLEKAEKSLRDISKKMTQNRVLLAFLGGSAIAAIGALAVLIIVAPK